MAETGEFILATDPAALNSQDGKFKRRCLELKAYIKTNGELPRRSTKTTNLPSHRLALWLRSLANNAGWTRPDRRAMLESLHPLVAELVAKWDTTPARIDLRLWQSTLQRVIACVQAKGHLPSSTSCDTGMYDWLNRNILRLERLPRELVKKLHDSHALVAAKVRAVLAKQVQMAGLKRNSEGAWKVPFFQGWKCLWVGQDGERCAILGWPG